MSAETMRAHATHLAILWLHNDAEFYFYWRDIAERASESLDRTTGRPAAVLARALSDYFEEHRPDIGPDIYSDFIGSMLRAVDWFEVADTMLDGVVSEVAK